MKTVTYTEIPHCIARRENFNGNTMSGRSYVDEFCFKDTGLIRSQETIDRWHKDQPLITYVVFSYSTPIAWETAKGEKYVVPEKFSVTTSRHQGMLYLF